MKNISSKQTKFLKAEPLYQTSIKHKLNDMTFFILSAVYIKIAAFSNVNFIKCVDKQ
jgi:hypothetical protein